MHAVATVTLTLAAVAGILFGSDYLDRRLLRRAQERALASPATARRAAIPIATAPSGDELDGVDVAPAQLTTRQRRTVDVVRPLDTDDRLAARVGQRIVIPHGLDVVAREPVGPPPPEPEPAPVGELAGGVADGDQARLEAHDAPTGTAAPVGQAALGPGSAPRQRPRSSTPWARLSPYAGSAARKWATLRSLMPSATAPGATCARPLAMLSTKRARASGDCNR